MLETRKTVAAAVNDASTSKRRVKPRETCALFGELERMGETAITWIETNREWCSIPDAFAEGLKAYQTTIIALGHQACGLVHPVPLKSDPLPVRWGG